MLTQTRQAEQIMICWCVCSALSAHRSWALGESWVWDKLTCLTNLAHAFWFAEIGFSWAMSITSSSSSQRPQFHSSDRSSATPQCLRHFLHLILPPTQPTTMFHSASCDLVQRDHIPDGFCSCDVRWYGCKNPSLDQNEAALCSSWSEMHTLRYSLI